MTDNGLTSSPKISNMTKTVNLQLYQCQIYKEDWIKVLSCGLLQCLGPVNTLTTERSSEEEHAMDLSNHLFSE